MGLVVPSDTEQDVPWHSSNYRVWIHSETRTWHNENIQCPFWLTYLLIYSSVINLSLKNGISNSQIGLSVNSFSFLQKKSCFYRNSALNLYPLHLTVSFHFIKKVLKSLIVTKIVSVYSRFQCFCKSITMLLIFC